MLSAMLLSMVMLGPLDEHYVVVFSVEPNVLAVLRPDESHVFAAWVRVRDGKIVEQVDVSWCPEGPPDILGRPQPGKNKTVSQSLKESKGWDLVYRVLRTDRSMFEAAKRHVQTLTQYVALDAAHRPEAVNCIHAVSDVGGHLKTGLSRGHGAAAEIARFFISEDKAWVSKESWVAEKILRDAGWEIPDRPLPVEPIEE